MPVLTTKSGLVVPASAVREPDEITEIDVSRQRGLARLAGVEMEPEFKGYVMGNCTIFVGRSKCGWHLSIAHPGRYPTWDEITRARYELIPNDVTMAMLLPPREEYVDVHRNCFHLWQVVDKRPGHIAEICEVEDE